MPEERVKRTDYFQSQPIPTPPNQAYQGHFRAESVDVVDDGYDHDHEPHQIGRSDSRTPLTPPHDTNHLLPIAPQGPTQQYLSPPQPLPTTGLNAAGNRVHYPPSPYMAKHQEYSTIPLNDQTPISGRSSPMPTPVSGQSTPNGTGNKKKHWSFLPMHSTPSSLEAGENINEKQKKRPKSSRNNSWDLLGDRAEWDEFNPAQASVENLRYAEGDVGTNKLSRLYYWALNRGIVVRWALYILPILALLWLPGILGVTAEKNATIWHIKLIWWSIWATVVWVGFWVSTAVFLMLPSIWRNTVGSIIPTARAYTDVVRNLGFYAKLIAWTLANWISFTPLLINHYTGDQSATSRNDLTTFANVLFGIFLCTIVLAVEKLIIQLIALQFHRDSYEDRLKEQKMNVRCLTTLYINSHDIPGRMDTLTDGASGSTGRTRATKIPQIAIRKALRGLKSAAQNTTTALGNVASEMAGQSVLQTNSPANKVTAALSSANKSRALARRIFYSYRQGGADHLDISDIARYFPDLETAQAAFSIFDKDGNGDATRDEIDASVLGMHRERLSLEASMRDLDGAVRRLDDIFMVVVVAISILILAATITTKLTTLVTSAGTFILGLSWLIGSTMQEILGACIFLFVKHPYDVGDRVDIDGSAYTVVKMNLMSTSFKRVDGKYVWIGHNILTTKVIENVRRSGATSESFIFEVDFETSFETLQELRGRMLRFVKDNSRDFQPVFDVTVDDIPAQGKMVLKADIRYKSNWQQGALKVQRRNKWVCALKMTLKDLKIWGPGGAGDPSPPPPDPVKYTLVPYEPTQPSVQPESPPPTFQTATAAHHATSLTGRREVINDPSQDIWDEEDELGSASRPGTPGPNTPVTDSGMRQRLPPVQVTDGSIEMTSAPVARR